MKQPNFIQGWIWAFQDLVADISFRVFLWAIRVETQDEYWDHIYEQERYKRE